MKGVKTGGRTAGTPNKITQAIRDKISETVQEYYLSENFTTDIQALNNRERIEYIRRITDYILPKPKPIEPEIDYEDSGVSRIIITSAQDCDYIRKLQEIMTASGLEYPEQDYKR
jgi:hypothetical protein